MVSVDVKHHVYLGYKLLVLGEMQWFVATPGKLPWSCQGIIKLIKPHAKARFTVHGMQEFIVEKGWKEMKLNEPGW